MKRFVGFMNAYTQGKSGGDVWFIESVKRMERFDKLIVTSLLGRGLCVEEGLRAEFAVTTRESVFKNAVFTYVIRILIAVCRRYRGDIYYGSSDFLPDVAPCLLGRITNPGSVWVQKIYHLIPRARFIPYYAQKISLFFIKKRADLILTDNNILKRDLEKMGFKGGRVKVVPFGVDIKEIESIPPAQEQYDAVFLGRLKKSKGVFDLPRIWAYVCNEMPSVRLAVIGYGDSKAVKELRKEIKREGMEQNIDILGYLSRQDAFGIVKSCKIFVFPSYEEGFGIAVLEAMACGLPVTAYSLPVYEDIFPKGIIKVPPGSVAAFGKACVHLLKDAEKYGRIKEEAGILSRGFALDKMLSREVEYINDTLTGAGRRVR